MVVQGPPYTAIAGFRLLEQKMGKRKQTDLKAHF